MGSTARILLGVPLILLAAGFMNFAARDDAPGGVLIGLVVALVGGYLAATGTIAKGVNLGLEEREQR